MWHLNNKISQPTDIQIKSERLINLFIIIARALCSLITFVGEKLGVNAPDHKERGNINGGVDLGS